MPADPRKCEYCEDVFTPRRGTARFCSDTCRAKAYNHRKNGSMPPREGKVIPMQPIPASEPLEGRVLQSNPLEMGDVERLTRRDLELADRLDTPIGATCITLARRLDNPKADTGSAMSS